MDDRTRLSLLQRLRNPADNSAWAEFQRAYEPLLVSYVRKKNVPEHDAALVVQDIVISLWRSLPTFQLDQSRGRFRTWLFQVTMNAVTDYYRRKTRGARHVVGMTENTPEPIAAADCPDAEWDREFERRLYEMAVERVRATTVEATWACFEKYLQGNRTAEDVGVELGMLPNTVRKNASRVLTRIREAVREQIEEMEA